MTQLVTDNPQKQCDVLAAKGIALLAADYRYLDPEMAGFISHYLHALAGDVSEVISSESKEQKALLPLIISELHELVEETQHRIEWAKGTTLKVGEFRDKDNPGWQRHS